MSSIPHAELEAFRTEFPILQTRTYLNSCSLGALSRRSMGYLGEYQALWNTMGASAWYELWMGRIGQLKQTVATMWNADEKEIALSPSVSGALSSIASAIDYTKRNKIVVAELDFPTLVYQWLARNDVEVVRVPSDDGIGVPPERWAEYVDERTALVATSHVFYGTGYVQDLAPIAKAARDAGALFLVDGYQSAGQIRVDPRAVDADIYVAGPLKWLCGGPGIAFLWVRQERIAELRPTIASWFGARDQFQFRNDELEFRDDAGRFSMGTPAVPTVYTALGGLEIFAEAGQDRIYERIAALTEDVVTLAQEAGFELKIAEDPARRSGIVLIRNDDAPAAVRRLADKNIIVDHRAGYVRVSPHFYNTPEENRKFIAALRG
ncbi:aminotransferase class V-fold PLP-dependent enzyme [Longimicrobium terrae]|uniref:Selenocysteine lyase/cysteine desulfurase n=1 Tax=Longimicrobium terrae TaxID=1639882 RepID=A0A841H2X6_9BACT|nr:aminotransferase class V-fold PLP-dependent enzyme [Longimicrobium terrae]MBB4637869.1 selenocysteine lyase/cysteine desulfurase [Longimicrobium terrae]MBB6072276.1 selenocysteine lyase/cysteine desulfurase [Longimicrobium terrae]NNC31198.1 aminotransferase class V-fold PLP-dependent enzyme [Longimicrobium terrae]